MTEPGTSILDPSIKEGARALRKEKLLWNAFVDLDRGLREYSPEERTELVACLHTNPSRRWYAECMLAKMSPK